MAPSLFATLAVVAERIIRLEATGVPVRGMPHWLDEIVWAPFYAWMLIAALQSLTSGKRAHWQNLPAFDAKFALIVLALAATSITMNLVPQIEPAIRFFYLEVWAVLAGSNDRLEFFDPRVVDPRVVALVLFLADCLMISLRSLIALAVTPLLWSWMVTGKAFAASYFGVVRNSWLRALAFFIIFEIVFHQMSVLFWVTAYRIAPKFPPPAVLDWRDHVLPELLFQLLWLPFLFIGGFALIVSSTIIFCRWVEERTAT